eukprot:m51a1_g2343 hypothetical protein (735) ;mRNA; r:557151-562002
MIPVALLLLGATLVSSVPCGLRTLDPSTGKTWAYDLRPLTHPDGHGADLMALAGASNATRYFLNLCGATLACPGDAVCMQDPHNKTHSLGATSSLDIFPSDIAEAGHGVKVTFDHGEGCVDEKKVARLRSTTVYVGCTSVRDRSWIAEVHEGACDTTYHVLSPHACATEVVPEPRKNDTMPLTFVAKDPQTGRRWGYDLSSLNHPSDSGVDMRFSATETASTFFVNLGGSTTKCPGSVVCEMDSLYKLHDCGHPKTQTISTNGDVSQGVVLTYSDGEVCEEGQTRTVAVAVRCSSIAKPTSSMAEPSYPLCVCGAPSIADIAGNKGFCFKHAVPDPAHQTLGLTAQPPQCMLVGCRRPSSPVYDNYCSQQHKAASAHKCKLRGCAAGVSCDAKRPGQYIASKLSALEVLMNQEHPTYENVFLECMDVLSRNVSEEIRQGASSSTCTLQMTQRCPQKCEAAELLPLWEAIQGRFNSAGSAPQLLRAAIKRIVVWENDILEQQFVVRADIIERRRGKDASKMFHFASKDPDQTAVLQRLRQLFEPQDLYKKANFVFAWHGCSPEKAESICQKGFANIRSTDGGYFGGGVYLTPQASYAVPYSCGKWSNETVKKTEQGEYAVVLAAVVVGLAYPITRKHDYSYPELNAPYSVSAFHCAAPIPKPVVDEYVRGNKEPLRDALERRNDKALKPSFDAHFVGVSSKWRFQASPPGEIEFDEIVTQEQQTLPLAIVYWRPA